ncbi:MAG: AMP-dependent synthetase/ligase, partial [Myxococcota bacterium]
LPSVGAGCVQGVGVWCRGDAVEEHLRDGWQTLRWQDVARQVRQIACGLKHLGLEPEQRCAILAETRVEWILADLGVLCAAGATTTIFPASATSECAHILNDSKTRFVFVDTPQQLDRLRQIRDQIPGVERVILIEQDERDGDARDDAWALSLQALMRHGKHWDEAHPDDYLRAIKRIPPDALATLIYTSGTTGQPKGVELTHDCWLFEAEAIDALGFLSPADTQYLWLPLAHSFGKVLEVTLIRIGIPTAVDGSVDRLVDNLRSMRPTFIAAVPQIFERIFNQVRKTAEQSGRIRKRMFEWAFEIGRQVSQLQQQGRSPEGMLSMQHALAERMVFQRIRSLFGGKIRFFISGSAPLPDEIAEFFHAAGLLILEGYGLTESSAASFVNRPDRFKFGTVGPPVPGVQVRLAEDDSEILLKGRGIMRAYFNLAQDTADAFDHDGWLKTGDIGEIDEDNFLRIVDRKKDLIKTSSGKLVAPQKLEGRLLAACPYIRHVLVHGDRRSFCVALITLDDDAIAPWLKDNGLGELRRSEQIHHHAVKTLIQRYVDAMNVDLARHETIRDFTILSRPFSVENGELTASLKLKRRAVEEKHSALLNQFYTDATKKP